MMNKGFHALFHRNRRDAFTLNALQPFFDNLPFGGVDHDWYTGDIRLTGNQAENAPSPLALEHPHPYLISICALSCLLTGASASLYFSSLIRRLNLGRAGDVDAFYADVDHRLSRQCSARLRVEKGGRRPGYPALARRQTGNGAAHGGDMLRRSATAAAGSDIRKPASAHSRICFAMVSRRGRTRRKRSAGRRSGAR